MCMEEKNADGKKPREVFTKSHEELVKEGAAWARETGRSFTIVCTLIITMMFAAAITVPGGKNQESGFPIFLNRTLFEVFMLADAISLVASSASVLISIGILTSRCAEMDFLKTVPLMLLYALFFLFLSVVAMIVAFCAGIAMMLRDRRVVIGAMSLAVIPVGAFMFTQLSLFKEICMSTMGLDWIQRVFKFIKGSFRCVFIYVIFWPYIIFIYIIKKIMGYCREFVSEWNSFKYDCFNWAAKIKAKCSLWAAAWTGMPSAGYCRGRWKPRA